jgi:hypothetical protein
MLKELQFVKGAVAKKNFDPTLTHFLIRNRRVWGFNGVIGLSSPIECDLDIAPQGYQFLRALNACDETVSLALTPSGKLSIASGRFKTTVDCVPPEEHKALPPAGGFVELNGTMLKALRVLEPFIGFDASRQWACGILFRGAMAYATNNIVFMQYWLGADFPLEVNIPAQAVRELLRINEEPLGLQICEDRLTFYYSGSRWLMTKLSALEWPGASLDAIFKLTESASYAPVTEDMMKALEVVAPFADDMGRVYFDGRSAKTSIEPTEATAYDFDGAPAEGLYNVHQLLNLRGVALSADFSAYPKPVSFMGDSVRGVIAGLRI